MPARKDKAMSLRRKIKAESRTILGVSLCWGAKRGYVDVQEQPMETVYKFHDQYGITGWKDYFAVSKSRWKFKPRMPGIWYYSGLPRLRRGRDWLYKARRFKSPEGFYIWGPIERVETRCCRDLYWKRKEN